MGCLGSALVWKASAFPVFFVKALWGTFTHIPQKALNQGATREF